MQGQLNNSVTRPQAYEPVSTRSNHVEEDDSHKTAREGAAARRWWEDNFATILLKWITLFGELVVIGFGERPRGNVVWAEQIVDTSGVSKISGSGRLWAAPCSLWLWVYLQVLTAISQSSRF